MIDFADKSLVVAYSGGADSTALLMMAAQQCPGQVAAVHVHHGLQAAADDFAAHCEAFCAALNVPLQVLRVNAKAAAGQSPEDAARLARYTAISEAVLKQYLPSEAVLEEKASVPGTKSSVLAIKNIANEDARHPVLLLAQHADDQVETLLLALSRGAGVDGLAGMAPRFERYGLQWARPFLLDEMRMGAQQIRQWLAAQGLRERQPGQGTLGQGWVEDPTNAQQVFTRNRIRAQLLPALREAFPQYQQTFARSARNLADASAALQLSAQLLEERIGLPPRIADLQQLARPLQANYLRYWLKSQHGVTGSQAQLSELLDQVAACTTRGHRIELRFAAGRVRRKEAHLSYEPSANEINRITP
jgi:tRNA(Ile)-lysidine synthase